MDDWMVETSRQEGVTLGPIFLTVIGVLWDPSMSA